MNSSVFDGNEIDFEPLASRMRPDSMDDFVTSCAILAPGGYLRRAIENDKLSSLIISGPPGCGKTTLANIIIRQSAAKTVSLNAAVITLSTVKEEAERADEICRMYGKKTILFIDEVHRLNKQSQDALLPYVEKGTVILIGATTENPYYAMSNALISRSRVIQLQPLSEQEIAGICSKAMHDKGKGFGDYNIKYDDNDLLLIAKSSGGDARIALNILENCILMNVKDKAEAWTLDKKIIEENVSKYALLYDKNGDYHYDTISAFIKSVRGSDPDAALFYLFTMLERGEDPLFIFRRMYILAAEDVGLADPTAITVVNSCKCAFEAVGLPEGEYHLAMAALYLSLTHKSSSVSCFFAAKEAAKMKNYPVPLHLRNKGPEAKKYKYPHEFFFHYVQQQYLPDDARNMHFYKPGDLGFEKKLKELYLYRKSIDENK